MTQKPPKFKGIWFRIVLLPLLALMALILIKALDWHFEAKIRNADATSEGGAAIALEVNRLLLLESQYITAAEEWILELVEIHHLVVQELFKRLKGNDNSPILTRLLNEGLDAFLKREESFHRAAEVAYNISLDKKAVTDLFRKSDRAVEGLVDDIDARAARLILEGQYLSEVKTAFRNSLKEFIGFSSSAMLNTNDLLSFSDEEKYLKAETQLEHRLRLTTKACENYSAVTGDPKDYHIWLTIAAKQDRIRALRTKLYQNWTRRQVYTRELEEANNGLIQLTHQLSHQAKLEMASLRKRQANTEILAVVVMLVLVGVLSFFLIRSITGPLKRVTQALVDFSQGRATGLPRSGQPRQDEIGQLEESFRRMIEKNDEVVDLARALADGDYGIKVRPRSEEDELSRSLAAMNESLRRFSQALEERSEDLERQVDQRTEELSRTVEELRRTMALRQEMEDALRAKEEQVRLLLSSTAEAIYGLDLEGNCTFCNRAGLRFLGYDSEEELLGQRMHRLIHHTNPDGSPNMEKEEVARAYLEGRSTHIHDELFWRSDGTSFPVELWSHPVMKGEEVVGAVVSFLDITERKKAEEERDRLEAQLRQAQKMEAIGTLAGGIAHDFNNILSAIIGYSELVLEDSQAGEVDSRQVKEILKAGRRAKDLVTQILTFSRKLEPALTPINLNRVILQTEKMLERTIPRMIRIENDLADDLRLINADSSQLIQVIMNLATNAADAMPEGGRLTLGTRNAILGPGEGDSPVRELSGEFVALTVSDTGHGVDPDTLEHIFDPFYTQKEVGQGTGLGLSMVYGIVKNHGGHIECRSRVGKGTRFEIYLPALKTRALEQPRRAERVAVQGGKETILLVDDEESIRSLGDKMLGRAGYHVLFAETGEKALEIYGTEKSEIDLIILDISMPGMGGHRCFRELRRLNPEVPVIISSGYSRDGRLKDTLALGAAGFVPKPFSKEEMLAMIREVLDK